jgi:hypothetical protein
LAQIWAVAPDDQTHDTGDRPVAVAAIVRKSQPMTYQRVARRAVVRRSGVTLAALALCSAFLLMFANTASAAIVPKVPLATAGNYSVLAGQGVTNVGNSTMHQDLGSSPNGSVVGYPPGLVIAPGVADNGDAAQAQLDLTAAYDNAHLRPTLTGTTPNDLSGRNLVGGVYAATAKGPLSLTGTVTLNGQGDPNTVWIFQTDSSLITGSGSVVSLINGAQECNVYWQVLSSATLGSGSTFVGNILALTSIQMQDSVTVHGRALARNGSVTLINDHFTNPTCATAATAPTTAAPATTTPPATPGATTPGGVIAPGTGTGTGTGTGVGVTTTTLGLTVGIVGPPRTGVAPLPHSGFPWTAFLIVGTAGAATTGVLLRRRSTRGALRSDS